MSTRYVWGKYSVEEKYIKTRTVITQANLINSNQSDAFAHTLYSENTEEGLFHSSGTGHILPIENDPYKYIIDTGIGPSADWSPIMYEAKDPGWWMMSRQGVIQCYATQYDDPGVEFYKWEYNLGDAKGTIQGYASSSASSTYPQDGVSGSSWYDYQGSDNIDPTACSIPASIMGGTPINITVTPGSGKVYEGTVQYEYQVKLGTGSWTTIATTSATTQSYTVPYGTESIQARVRAKDNIGFTSTDYLSSSSVTVINNQPPTAPGSIQVTGVVSGQQANITLTAATDPDGTVASYIYERSVDGTNAWTQLANVNSLTQTDTISSEWGTVIYRAKAVDDDGEAGPYVTGTTNVVNSGWVILDGPENDMGSKPIPFEFSITPSVSGETATSNIQVDITLDGKSIYSEAVTAGTEITKDIDTRVMRTGNHSIAVAASCADYVPAAAEYTFSVPETALPDGGRLDQLQGMDGQVIFPQTLARAVAGLENYGIEQKVHLGTYTGTGTYGSGNQNQITSTEFEPKIVIIQGTAGRTAILVKPSGIGISIGPNGSSSLTVSWDGGTVKWYSGTSAAEQMNTSSEVYSYTIFG